MLSKSEVKYIQTLSQKKQRVSEGLYIIEGPKIVDEAIQSKNTDIQKIYALSSWISDNKNKLKNIDHLAISDWELEKISQLKTPNLVIAIVHIPKETIFKIDKKQLCIALDGIQDPGNLGTIIRIADWFGIKQIVCSADCADVYNAKVVQSTMGSIFRIQILYTDLAQWLNEHPDTSVYGAVLNGTPLTEFTKPTQGILLIGNESKGIRENILPYISEKITIEKIGEAESLNAAVATGIILSHLV